MTDSYFCLVKQSEANSWYRSDGSTGGPWGAGLQHGGPPNALLVHAAEAEVARITGRSDLIALRAAADFVGPVPVADLCVNVQILRQARSAVLAEAVLIANDRECLRSRVWFVRVDDTAAIAHSAPADRVPTGGFTHLTGAFPYGDSIEWRFLSGSLSEPGPGLVWARPRQSIIDDAPLSGLQRAVLIGDSSSGISSALDWGTWSFLNVDLDVHLARPFVGEWLRVDAQTQLGPSGSALAISRLGDVDGPLGTTAQTLVLAPRRG